MLTVQWGGDLVMDIGKVEILMDFLQTLPLDLKGLLAYILALKWKLKAVRDHLANLGP